MFFAIAAAALAASTPGIAKADLWMVAASGDTRRIRPVAVAQVKPAKPLIRRPKQGTELAAIIARVKRENGIKG